MATRKIFITHCSAKKNEALKGKVVTVQELYTGQRIQAFMRRCLWAAVEWGILSDKYGIVFPGEAIEYYELHPDQLTHPQIRQLIQNFVERLGVYDEILFYHNPPRFHRVYRYILDQAQKQFRAQKSSTRIILFSKLDNISPEPIEYIREEPEAHYPNLPRGCWVKLTPELLERFKSGVIDWHDVIATNDKHFQHWFEEMITHGQLIKLSDYHKGKLSEFEAKLGGEYYNALFLAEDPETLRWCEEHREKGSIDVKGYEKESESKIPTTKGSIGKKGPGCIQAVREVLINVEIDNGSDREEAEEIVDAVDWDSLRESFKKNEYGFTQISGDLRAAEALAIVKSKVPQFYDRLVSMAYIFGSKYYVPYPTFIPFVYQNISKAAIIIPEYYLPLRPAILARALAHEMFHLDINEHPEVYDIHEKSFLAVLLYTHLVENKVDEMVDQLGFGTQWEAEVSYARSMSWDQATYKIFPEDAIMRILACLKGGSYNPKYIES
jgi:hypothetical protein